MQGSGEGEEGDRGRERYGVPYSRALDYRALEAFFAGFRRLSR